MTTEKVKSKQSRGVYLSIVRADRLKDGRIWYIAEHPALPGCMSDGSKPDEALANLDDARELYITSMLDDGLEVPEPNLATEEISVTVGTRRTLATSLVVNHLQLRRHDETPKEIEAVSACTVAG